MKYALFLSLLLAGACALLRVTLLSGEDEEQYDPRAPEYWWPEMREIIARERKLEKKAVGVRHFHKRNEAVKAELRSGRTTLREAACFMTTVASECYPEFLAMLSENNGPGQAEMHMASRLVFQLTVEEAEGQREPEEAGRLECVRAELERWLSAGK